MRWDLPDPLEVLIERPTEDFFHYMCKWAKLKAYKRDDEFRHIEDRRNENGHRIFLGYGLTIDDWRYQSDKMYEVMPSLRLWHKLQLTAKAPRKWIHERKARRMRAKKGYDSWAVHDFHSWHTHHMIEILTEYQKNMHGHPAGMSFEQWNVVVNGIIDAFKAIKESDENDLDFDEAQRRVDFAFRALATYYLSLWD